MKYLRVREGDKTLYSPLYECSFKFQRTSDEKSTYVVDIIGKEFRTKVNERYISSIDDCMSKILNCQDNIILDLEDIFGNPKSCIEMDV